MILWMLTAWAQDLVTYDADNIVEHGKQIPSITFRVRAAGTYGFALDCGEHTWRSAARNFAAGDTHVLALDNAPKGSIECVGSILVETSDGRSGTLSFQMPVSSIDPLAWTATMEHIDLEKRTAQPQASRPLSTASLELIGEDGKVFETVPADLSDPSRPSFHWNRPLEVLQLRVRAKDGNGATSTLRLSPWSYQIPHEDVVFASGDAKVTTEEAQKLEATWTDIQRVLAKYGDIVDIQLFVVGYTDTVGTRSSNLALSKRRAHSIARWFRDRGFTRPVRFQGFGEAVQALDTPDEVDEALNRRALYILSANTPTRSTQIPAQNWTSL